MSKKILIWDLPLRIFHWSFASAIFFSWYSGEQGSDYIDYHLQSGYFILTLLCFRIVWGFIGPKHARFSQFIPSPTKLIHYITTSKTESVGHNPLGALMVLVMLLLVTIQAVSGLFINDDVFTSGPYYASVSVSFSNTMNYLHHNIFNLILLSIALHLAAIFYYQKIKKQDLMTPMLTGKKLLAHNFDNVAINNSKLLLAFILICLASVFIYWLVVINVPEVEEFFY